MLVKFWGIGFMRLVVVLKGYRRLRKRQYITMSVPGNRYIPEEA